MKITTKLENKICNIEFLRLILLFSIIFFHMFGNSYLGAVDNAPFYTKVSELTRNGYLAVEAFFIIGGFFLALKFTRRMSIRNFVIQKLGRLLPVIVAVILFYAIFSLFFEGNFALKNNLLTILLLNGFIKSDEGVINSGHLWFVSIYFWVSLLFFCILKLFNKKMAGIILAACTMCAFAVAGGGVYPC